MRFIDKLRLYILKGLVKNSANTSPKEFALVCDSICLVPGYINPFKIKSGYVLRVWVAVNFNEEKVSLRSYLESIKDSSEHYYKKGVYDIMVKIDKGELND